MPTDHYNYAGHIRRLIDQTPAKGTVTVRHNRRKYEIPMVAAKELAFAIWNHASRLSYVHPDPEDTFPNIHLYASAKTTRKAASEHRLVVRGTKKADKRQHQYWLDRGGSNWGKRLSETGIAVARSCFREVTGIDLGLAAAEVQRLRDEQAAFNAARTREIEDGLRGLHKADGSLLTNLRALRDDDELVVAQQIKALREQAAQSLTEGL